MLPKEDIPEEFKSFLKHNHVDLHFYYTYTGKQYVTVLGDTGILDASYTAVPWLPSTFVVPPNTHKPANPNLFYMDAASALAVLVVDPRDGEHILDICCAPGMKLSLMGRMVGACGSVTGVDISRHRLSTCRSIVKAHKVGRCRLFCEDGTSFGELPVQVGYPVDRQQTLPTPFYQSTAYRRFPCSPHHQQYDKVIVDAQCTHDGSIKHIQKADSATWSSLRHQFAEGELAGLYDLQYKLLQNGYEMCRPGGAVIYSTCSFSVHQNEHIVEHLLRNYPEARLEPLSVPNLFDSPAHYLRVDPRQHDCGFLFIAKIIKGHGVL